MKSKSVKVLESKVVYESDYVSVRHDKWEKPDGTPQEHDVAERKNLATVVAEKNGKLFLVSQFRYAIGEDSLEFPGGFVDKGESFEEAAARELEEETGFKANKIIKLGMLWVSTGFLTQQAHIFFASDLKEGNVKHDESESDMTYQSLTIEEVREKIKKNEIKASTTVAAFGLYLMYKNSI